MANSGEGSLISERIPTSLWPFIIGLMGPTPESDQDRVVLVNPATQGLVVLRGDASAISEMLFSAGGAGGGVAPASKEAIEAMRSVDSEELENEEGECSICLDGLKAMEEVGVKEMPCRHRFHGGCIEKWLRMHGSCPVCRFDMPKEEREAKKERTWEVWVTISIRRRERDGDDEDDDGDDHQEQN